jgi:hypothetical protein
MGSPVKYSPPATIVLAGQSTLTASMQFAPTVLVLLIYFGDLIVGLVKQQKLLSFINNFRIVIQHPI